MNPIEWLASKMTKSPVKVTGDEWCVEMADLYADVCYRELAMYTAIDLIAKSISKCEFKEFQAKKEQKGHEWYRWNIEPNKNQSSTAFLRKLIFTLFYRGECLVVQTDSQEYLVADSFIRKPMVLKNDIFEQVTIDDFVFNKVFYGNEVFYWCLDGLGSGQTIQNVLSVMLDSYSKLLAYGMKFYKTQRGSKGIFKYGTLQLPPSEDGPEAAKNKWLESQYKKFSQFLTAENGVVAIGEGTSFEPYGNDKKSTLSAEGTRDLRHLVDDISDFTAKAFGIPPAMLRGDVEGTKDALDQFLTFCIDPLADFLHEEIVRKTIGRTKLLQGYDLQIDTSTIKHIDLIDGANGIDKLIGSGVCSVNDILKLLGRTPIDEPWANLHYITKNYEPFTGDGHQQKEVKTDD